MNLVCEGTLEIEGLKEVDVNDKDQILARRKVDDRYYIRVMNRLSKASNEFPSECNHFFVDVACLIAHPTDPGFVLEGCWMCKVIRNYNIHTGECSIVYKGYTLFTICHGPAGSILTYWPRSGVSIMKWDEEHHKLHTDKRVHLDGEVDRMCYSELNDMLVGVYEHKEIQAVMLEGEAASLKLSAPIWKLSGVMDGCLIKPDTITSDTKGNIYVTDGENNRILKINSFTGDIVSILLLEEENKTPIDCLFWSNTEPNLTVVRGYKICSYCIPRPD